jgi:tetratricopeptide (TPR) repeat protein
VGAGSSSGGKLVSGAAALPVDRCLINPSWQEEGVAGVVVVRRMPGSRFLAAGFLVDVFCLGVKDAMVRSGLTRRAVRAFLENLPWRLQEVAYQDARSVVLGAVEYARGLGFEPCRDWASAGELVESGKPFDRRFSFGREGRPLYIQGPFDDVASVMARLAPLIRTGKADFIALGDAVGAAGAFEDRVAAISGLMEDGLVEEARAAAADLVGEFPGRAEPPFLLGTCLAMDGEKDRAVEWLERSIELGPSPQAYYNLASAHRALWNLRESVACLGKVVELDGKRGEYGRMAARDLGSLRRKLQKSSGISLERYLELERRFDEAFGHLRSGRFEEAARGFSEVLEVLPDHVQARGNLGIARAALGDREEAIRDFDRALELDPTYQPALENRRTILGLGPEDTLEAGDLGEVDFYRERALAAGR